MVMVKLILMLMSMLMSFELEVEVDAFLSATNWQKIPNMAVKYLKTANRPKGKAYIKNV